MLSLNFILLHEWIILSEINVGNKTIRWFAMHNLHWQSFRVVTKLWITNYCNLGPTKSKYLGHQLWLCSKWIIVLGSLVFVIPTSTSWKHFQFKSVSSFGSFSKGQIFNNFIQQSRHFPLIQSKACHSWNYGFA